MSYLGFASSICFIEFTKIVLRRRSVLALKCTSSLGILKCIAFYAMSSKSFKIAYEVFSLYLLAYTLRLIS
jgi:hypothetical protein